MVFFQLNVTGLLFQSFRTASPHLNDERHNLFLPIGMEWFTKEMQSQ